MPKKQRIRFNTPVGHYVLTGDAVSFPSNESLSGITATFALTGIDASLQTVSAPFIIADAGLFNLTGIDAALNAALTSNEDVGLFALTAPDASFQVVLAPFIIADTTPYSLTGNDAALSVSVASTLNADTGLFQVITTNSSVEFFVSQLTTPSSIGVLNNMLPPGPNQIGIRRSVFSAGNVED